MVKQRPIEKGSIAPSHSGTPKVCTGLYLTESNKGKVVVVVVVVNVLLGDVDARTGDDESSW